MSKQLQDLTMRDLAGAVAQWQSYVTDTLGYDELTKIEFAVDRGRYCAYIIAGDKFQEGLDYSKRVGRCSILEYFKRTDEWDVVCKVVWERLQKCMKRDEREIRHGLTAMGGIIENNFQSEVGKLFAERIRKARDEATNHMIEHHGWKA